MHFLLRAKALVTFPGGFGTLDELFDALTLRQTERMQKVTSTVVVFGGTQIVERDPAEKRLARANRELAKSPDDSANPANFEFCTSEPVTREPVT
jgi:predicted Rossmann-fold nucleotide-binding protein